MNKFKCSGFDRKKKSEKKAKKAEGVDDQAEEENVPPRADTREPRAYDKFVPSDVVNDLLLKATEERGEPIIVNKKIFRQKSVAYMFIRTFGTESEK